jgi:hypothetical protein
MSTEQENRPVRLPAVIGIFVVAAVIASAVSHFFAHWLGMAKDPVELGQINSGGSSPPLVVGGSSLVYYAIDWSGIGARHDKLVLTRGSASASPSEIEQMPFKEAPAALRVLGISCYETNENSISNFRAEIVPVRQSFSDLWQSGASWEYSKGLLSHYPLAYARKPFPTAGRSVAFMVAVRHKARTMLHGGKSGTFEIQTNNTITERLTDWDEGRIERNVSATKAGLKREALFSGPKSVALKRIADTASKERPLLIIVLPVSPIYIDRLGALGTSGEFDRMLATVLHPREGLTVLRLDLLPEAGDPAKFCDLVHLNRDGSESATRIVEAEIERILPR